MCLGPQWPLGLGAWGVWLCKMTQLMRPLACSAKLLRRPILRAIGGQICFSFVFDSSMYPVLVYPVLRSLELVRKHAVPLAACPREPPTDCGRECSRLEACAALPAARLSRPSITADMTQMTTGLPAVFCVGVLSLIHIRSWRGTVYTRD